MKVYELLDSPDKWIKGNNAIDKDGEVVDPRSRKAICWCLMGALQKCYLPRRRFDKHYSVYREHAEKLTAAVRKKHTFISTFNDDPNTTYEDVINICKELDL